MARRTRRRGRSVVSRRAKASGLMTLLLAALPAASASGKGFSKEGQNVMNRGGVPYKIANPEGSVHSWKGTPGTYPIDFKLSVEGDVESFDVYVSSFLFVEHYCSYLVTFL